MIVSVASGKGGTGKTLVSTGLYRYLKNNHNVSITDLDVECPDTGIFLKAGTPDKSVEIVVQMPVIDNSKCTLCGKCVSKCNFKSILKLGSQMTIFSELCKSCLRCVNVCPVNAISTVNHEIGKINYYSDKFTEGVLKNGEIHTSWLIRETKNAVEKSENDILILDCPPGTTCPMVAAVSDTDYCIVTVEDSPYGFHDAVLTFEVLNDLNIPFGVIINKFDGENSIISEYCTDNKIDVIAFIPYSVELHEVYTSGRDIFKVEVFTNAMKQTSDFLIRRLSNV